MQSKFSRLLSASKPLGDAYWPRTKKGQLTVRPDARSASLRWRLLLALHVAAPRPPPGWAAISRHNEQVHRDARAIKPELEFKTNVK
jgi:hypothetical protein